MTASEAARAIREGKLSVESLAKACLARIGSRPEVKAWAYLDEGRVLEEARRLDKVPVEERSALFGLPAGIKDIFQTKGKPTWLQKSCESHRGY